MPRRLFPHQPLQSHFSQYPCFQYPCLPLQYGLLSIEWKLHLRTRIRECKWELPALQDPKTGWFLRGLSRWIRPYFWKMPALPPGLSLEPQYSLVRLRSSIHPWQQRVMR